MLAFLFLTLLLGVSRSQAAEDELEGVDGLTVDQDGNDLDLQYSRAKRQLNICPGLCNVVLGRNLAEGESDEKCDYTQILDYFFGKCNCCQDCAVPFSPCPTFGGVCKKRGGCEPTQFDDPLLFCKDFTRVNCACCRNCTTPSTCSNDFSTDGVAVCAGDITAMTKMPEYYRNPNGTCQLFQACECYNKCQGNSACMKLGGMCVQKDQNCKTDYLKFACGCTDTENCRCCVPKKNKRKAKKQLGCDVES